MAQEFFDWFLENQKGVSGPVGVSSIRTDGEAWTGFRPARFRFQTSRLRRRICQDPVEGPRTLPTHFHEWRLSGAGAVSGETPRVVLRRTCKIRPDQLRWGRCSRQEPSRGFNYGSVYPEHCMNSFQRLAENK